ncbi:MAG: hypothetical protein V4529_17430 [Gemmatimonadota bacterium]
MVHHLSGVLLGLVLVLATAHAASAQSRTPPEATQHALDELANAIAQHKITVTPTPSPPPTSTPRPSATSAPVPTATDPPEDPPTAEPVLPFGANPVGGYLRPTTLPNPALYELALRQGRWDVDLGGCGLVGVWSPVWMFTQETNVVLAGVDYFAELDPALTCPIVGASWHSDTPCAQDDDGRCDVQQDGGYWDAQPQPTDPPAAETGAPVGAPPPTPTRVVARAAVQAAAAQPPAPRIVYQTAPTPEPVIVTVLATVLVVPTATPAPTRTPTLQPSPSSTATALPTSTQVPTLEPTATPGASVQQSSLPAGGFGFAGLGLGALAVVAMIFKNRNREDV